MILASSHYGFPLSTTQVISGGVMGAGAGKRVSAVRWGVAGNIVTAWLLTFPLAAAIGALTYGFTQHLRQRRGGPADRVRDGARRAGRVPHEAGAESACTPPDEATLMLIGFIDTGALAKTVAAAFIAGVGITLIFSLALYGVARFAEMGREGRNGEALPSAPSPSVAGLAFVAAIVIGIIVMTAK